MEICPIFLQKCLSFMETEVEHPTDLPPGYLRFAIPFQSKHLQRPARTLGSIQLELVGNIVRQLDRNCHSWNIAGSIIGGKLTPPGTPPNQCRWARQALCPRQVGARP